MFTLKKNLQTLTTAASVILIHLASPLKGQVPFETTYKQNFDTLPLFENVSGSSTFNFSNNVTLKGWHSTAGSGFNEGRSSGGSATDSGEIYNWGRSLDRALGTFSSKGYNDLVYFGLCLQNTSGKSIHNIDLDYKIEQWRRNTDSVTWIAEYRVSPHPYPGIDAHDYTLIKGSKISSQTGSARGLNGNLNSTQFHLQLSDLEWSPNTYLWIRWVNDQSRKTKPCGFGLDDLTITTEKEE